MLVPVDTHSHVLWPRYRGVVNVASFSYTVDVFASSDAATGLEVDGKAALATYTVHSTAPAYQEIEGACIQP